MQSSRIRTRNPTCERPRHDLRHRGKKRLVDIVSRHVTDLSKLRLVEEGIGFRPCTPDQFSVIGRVPYYENLYVASGNCRLGVTLAPASAYILRSIIRGEDCLDEIKPLLSPERFHS